MRRIPVLVAAIMVFGGLLAAPAGAQMIANPALRCELGYFEAGGALMFSTVEYEDTEIERQIAGGYVAYGVNDWFDLYGSLGLILDAEPEDWHESGSGFLIAGGARGTVYVYDPLSIIAYSELRYLAEDYGKQSQHSAIEGETVEGSVEAEGSLVELALGAVARYDITRQFHVYGGIDLIPYSDGEAEATGRVTVDEIGAPPMTVHIDETDDVSRDSWLGLRGGANFDFGGFWVRGELVLVSETTFLLGAGFYF